MLSSGMGERREISSKNDVRRVGGQKGEVCACAIQAYDFRDNVFG